MAIVPNKVFVRNLPFSCTNDQLSELFGSHGPVKQCFVVKDESADRCKGFGFVTFASKDDTKKVLGKDIYMEKRKLHIFPANKKEEGPTKKNFTPRKNTPKKANKAMKDEQEESDSEDKDNKKTDEKEDASSGEGEDKEDEEEEEEEKQKTTERGKKRKHKDQSNLKQSNGSPPKKARKEIAEGATLEIRNIPLRLRRDGINKFFEQFGGVANCKMIRDKKGGFVGKTFLSFETKAAAEECLKMGNQEDSPLIMNGQNLEISRALPPQRLNQSRQPETEEESKARSEWDPEGRIVVRNLSYATTTEELEEGFSKFGKVLEIKMPMTQAGKSTRNKGFAFLHFEGRDVAKNVMDEMNTKQFHGRPIAVDFALPSNEYRKAKQNVASQEKVADKKLKEEKMDEGEDGSEDDGEDDDEDDDDDDDDKERKSRSEWDPEGRIVVRNLSYATTTEELEEGFSKFGKVLEIKMPMTQAGKSTRNKGFAFLHFEGRDVAKNVMDEMNTKQFHGRPIAVDFALPSNEYRKAKQNVASQEKVADKTPKEEKMDEGEDGSEDDDDEDEDEDDDDDDDDDDSEEEEEAGKSQKVSKDDDESDEDEESGDEDEDEESDDEEEEGKKAQGLQGQLDPNMEPEDDEEQTSRDIKEERTVFIKNLPYEVTVPEIMKLFKQYGPVKFCALVKDPVTAQPRGTAFLQFHKKEFSDNCLRKTADVESTTNLELHGRRLIVAKALSRSDAFELQEKKKKMEKMEEKDKRNLYLLREGFIRPGTEAAAGLSKSDISKRSKVEAVKRAKIKNIYIFVSKTRLVVHNLPMTCNDTKLKDLFRSAVQAKTGVEITESRVMRDKDKLREDKKGKPLGYGFVSFTEHRHALEALRTVNNNAEYFGENRRPIVGFSLENMKALEKRQRQADKSKMKLGERSRTPSSKPKEKAQMSTDMENDPRAKMLDGGKTGPYKHPHAKLRWRDKGKKEAEARKEKLTRRRKLFKQQAGRKESQGVKENVRGLLSPRANQEQNKKRRGVKPEVKEERKFDSMVAKYKQKLNQSVTSKAGSKWFE